MRSFATILVASLPFSALASHLGNHPHRHSDLALRAHNQTLQKRDDRFTYYNIETGVTACGNTYSSSAFVVALNSAQFGGSYPSPECFKEITITANGKTTSAQIVDECPGCPYLGLDLTEGLFQFFAPLGVGVLSGTWEFAGAAPPPPQSTTSKPPTHTPTQEPTTQYTPPPVSHHATSTPPPSSTSSSSTSTSTSKTHSSTSTTTTTTSQPLSTPGPSSAPTQPNYNDGPASDIAQPSGTIVPDGQGSLGTIYAVYEAILGFGVISEVCKS